VFIYASVFINNKFTFSSQSCPYCKTTIRVTDNRRVYAVGDEEFGATAAAGATPTTAKIRELESELAATRDENRQIHSFLEACHGNLDSEQTAHDMLK